MNKKIFLIFPELDKEAPFSMSKPVLVPLGLLYLSGFLEKYGYEIKIIDNSMENLNIPDILKEIALFDPFIVGVSCYSSTYRNTLNILSQVKSNFGITTIVGGPHPTIMPESFNLSYVDFICRGEGEITFLELCNALKESKDISGILGIYHKIENKLIFNGDRDYISDMDILAHPKRSYLSNRYANRVDADEINAGIVYGVNTSRGCPFGCSYCSVFSLWGRIYRSFSVNWIVDEIKGLITEYGAQGIYFYEDNFTFSKKRVREICNRLINENIKITWACEGRVGSVDEEDLCLMKKAGCQSIKFGLETGSPELLKKIRKNIRIEEIKNTRKLCKEARIKFICFILYGIPGETLEDLKLTIDLLKEIKPDKIIPNYFKIIPGSDLYKEVLETGDFLRRDEAGFIYKNILGDYSWFVKEMKECIQ